MKKNSVFIILGILVGLNLLAWVAVWEGLGHFQGGAKLRLIGGGYGNKDIWFEIVIRVKTKAPLRGALLKE